jgi:glutamine synthetase
MSNDEEKKRKILEVMEKEKIKFFAMQFTDILGIAKSVTIPYSMIDKALEDGVLFDGSSIVGYATIEESDLKAVPDFDTFRILPWISEDVKTAGMICDIYEHDGKRFTGDPRYVLQRTMEKAKDMGFVYNTGPEFEFFLLRFDGNKKPTTVPSDHARYFDLLPLDMGDIVRKKTTLHLDTMGFHAETTHHEVAPGQHEIDLRYTDALTIADRIVFLKNAIRTVALAHELHATFMPKPIFGINGSGMHTHQSLMAPDGHNSFDDPEGKWQLSKEGLWFIGGILAHARETCAILASWVNSYKRLVPGFEAPVYISWANRNRSALIRVPSGRGSSARVEVRNPDPAGNPYLQFAAMLSAGLEGMRKKIEPPEPIETDIYKLPAKERKRLGIGSLPQNLHEALQELEKSALMKENLGAHVWTHFLYIKNSEWDEYRTQVTDWEVKRYLSML